MGRYYTGDIEGKFWFAVQDSDDASYFGGVEIDVMDEENENVIALDYYFDKEDLEGINDGIETCIEILGPNLEFLDKYFGPGGEGGNIYYSPESLAKQLGCQTWTDSKYRSIMEQYARLQLGKKIKECVERLGHCNFTAEL